VTSEWGANKQRVPGGGVGFNGEVADPQFFSPFSSDDDKQASMSFLGRTLPASKRGPLHGLAFLAEEAAKQEVLEQINSSLFSVDGSWSQYERVVPS